VSGASLDASEGARRAAVRERGVLRGFMMILPEDVMAEDNLSRDPSHDGSQTRYNDDIICDFIISVQFNEEHYIHNGNPIFRLENSL
jgi:hypothetical protein